MSGQWRRTLVGVLVTALVVAGCGGDDADDAATTTTTASDSDAGGQADDGDGDGDGDSDTDDRSDEVGAVVTIDGERFEATEELVCVGLGGALSAQFTSGDGVLIAIDLPPEDWETSDTGDWEAPSLRVDDERDPDAERQFESGPNRGVGTDNPDYDDVVVDSFSVDGKHASGTAMVVDSFAVLKAAGTGDSPPDPLPATFEFTCED